MLSVGVGCQRVIVGGVWSLLVCGCCLCVIVVVVLVWLLFAVWLFYVGCCSMIVVVGLSHYSWIAAKGPIGYFVIHT